MPVKHLRHFHLAMTIVWGLLIVPTVLFWHSSILWIALMSVWANFAAHFAAWQGTRAEDSETK